MQPSRGVISPDPDDGVLRGRVGARRWLCQVSLIAALTLVSCVIVLVLFFERVLILFIFLITLVGGLLASMRFCSQSWAWLGVDLDLPVIFDLNAQALEVRSWKNNVLKKRRWSLAAVQDLRVYRSNYSSEDGDDCAACRPLQNPKDLVKELPRRKDAVVECGNACLGSCMSSLRSDPAVSCAFLAAKVEGEDVPVRLSRSVWTLREAEALCALGRAARRKAGMPEGEPAAVLGATSNGDREGTPAPPNIP